MGNLSLQSSLFVKLGNILIFRNRNSGSFAKSAFAARRHNSSESDGHQTQRIQTLYEEIKSRQDARKQIIDEKLRDLNSKLEHIYNNDSKKHENSAKDTKD